MTGDELQSARKRLDLTQAALAEELGVATNTVYRWEAGLRAMPAWAHNFVVYLIRTGERP